MFGPGMHPRSLVHVTELEVGVCDGKTKFRAEREQPETATIYIANAMMTNDTMPYIVISAYSGIEIYQQGGMRRVIRSFNRSFIIIDIIR